MSKRMRVPPPGVAPASIVPPCASTSRFAIARPSPVPPRSADRTNRSNTYGSRSAEMPGPVSSTVNRAPLVPSAAIVTVTRPPSGVYRAAFASRLLKISASRTGSASIVAGAPWSTTSIVTPASSASARSAFAASSAAPRGSTVSRWSSSTPASAIESVRRSSSSRAITSVRSITGRRCSASSGYRPSSIPSVAPRIACSGVRSSCATSASSSRRRSSFVCRREVISSNAPASRWYGRPGTSPTRVV